MNVRADLSYNLLRMGIYRSGRLKACILPLFLGLLAAASNLEPSSFQKA
jgi:hypothetical protein